MSRNLLIVLATFGVAGGIMVGASSAGAAAGGTTVLHFRLAGVSEFTVGYSKFSLTPPPVGSQMVYVGAVYNTDVQFGKPFDAPVGRILVDCTTLVSSPPDGVCTGIVHVPDGFFTFAGNGVYTRYTRDHYGITGGVGPYANARGQITNLRYRTGGHMTVTLIG
jgi:hypothetical protein